MARPRLRSVLLSSAVIGLFNIKRGEGVGDTMFSLT